MSEDNIEPIPLRLDMLPEIAAIALPSDSEDGQPTVVLNSRELDQRATFSVFKDALVGSLIGWLGGRVGRWACKHQVATAVLATVAVGAVAVVGANAALVGDGTPRALPAPTVTVVATQAPSTLTLPPVRETVTAAPPKRTATATAPAASAPPHPRRSSAPPIRARTSPTRAPVVRRDPPTRPVSTPAREVEPTSKASQAPRPSRSAAPQAREAATEGRAPAPSSSPARSRPSQAVEPTPDPSEPGLSPGTENPIKPGCFVEVDIDPLLDVCIR